jgi:hypothetical protein
MNEFGTRPARILRSFSPKKQGDTKRITPVLVAIVVVFLGVGTGWLLSGHSVKEVGQKGSSSVNMASNVTQTQTEAGIADESTFSSSDAPIGILREGGVNGEGNYHLERPGGESQNVYLTSTVLDLKSFVGKKVQVWGETLSGQKAGWLMDVGKIKVVN